MKWVIIEDALKDKRGHYFEYISTFKQGLEACGDSVDVFVDHTAEEWILSALQAKAVLPRCIWRRMSDGSPRWKRLLRYPVHGLQTFFAVRRVLRAHRGADILFFPSVSTHHLLGLVPLLFLYQKAISGTVLLFFQCTPIIPAQTQGGAALNPDATARLFPFLLRLLRPLISSGRVVLGVETEAMRSALETLCELPFVYFPHPVSLPATSPPFRAQSGDHPSTILFGCYGTTRYEKGNDLLQLAACRYLGSNPDPRVRFVMQWTEDFYDEMGKRVSKNDYLLTRSEVSYITEYFPPDGSYMRQVAETGVMVLPYRDSYSFRLSRVVIEAMICGVPVIVPEKTTLAEQAMAHGAAVAFAPDDPDGLVGALRRAVADFSGLRNKARRCAPEAAAHFSVTEFRRVLLSCVQRVGRRSERQL